MIDSNNAHTKQRELKNDYDFLTRYDQSTNPPFLKLFHLQQTLSLEVKFGRKCAFMRSCKAVCTALKSNNKKHAHPQLLLFVLSKVSLWLVPPRNMRRPFIHLVMSLQSVFSVKQSTAFMALELNLILAVRRTPVARYIALLGERLVADITPSRLVRLLFPRSARFSTLAWPARYTRIATLAASLSRHFSSRLSTGSQTEERALT